MSKSDIARWSGVTGRHIAEAIFDETNGNCGMLTESTKTASSVWGKICKHLGKDFTKDRVVDRIWVEGCFSSNFGNLQVPY